MSTGSEKDLKGEWLWPGYGENSRVLKWIFERVSGEGQAIESPIGHLPAPGALDTSGLDISKEALHDFFDVDKNLWKKELAEIRDYFKIFGEDCPLLSKKK